MNLKFSQSKGKMTNREILLEMYEKLWEADKDKWAWNVILKDTLEKLEKCKHIKREGESCRLNNNCTYPNCKELLDEGNECNVSINRLQSAYL